MRDLQVLALVRILGLVTLAHSQTLFWPLAIIANEGGSAVFACSPFIGGSKPVLNIQRPGESSFTTVQTDDPRLSFQDFPRPNNPTNRTYTYSNVQRSEHGTMFTCNVNSIGAQEPGTLTVNFPPTYTDPGEQTVREGLGITVSLTVDSRPYELTVVSLTRDGGTTVPGDTTYDTVSVTFNDVQRSDAGVYILTSSNTAGEGSVSFTLNVEFPPTFTDGTGELTRGVRTGGSISLSCVVEGDPTPVVSYTPPVTDPSNAVFDNNTNMITIASAVSSQGAVRYTCTASNDVQSGVTLTYALFVGELPTVSGLNVVPDGDTVTISWTFTDGGIPRNELSFELRFTSTTSAPIVRTRGLPSDGMTFSVDTQSLGVELVAGTQYTVTLTVTSPVGTSTLLQQMFTADTPMSPTRPTSTIPRPKDGGDGSIIGGAVGGAVGGAIVITVALIIIITILKKQHTKQWHSESLPQATVDVPVTSNAAYNIVSFSGHENDPNVSQNIAYHTTQRQDMDTCDYDNIEPEGVAAPGSFTETPLYEPV